ncbi:MAG: heat shock protein 15 [Porticoccaceae bacterium]|jgi:ribosome-associated heat shock protein Hsp15|nr:RNA-binding protein [Porticoccaceae bacterium]GIR40802.1 MAG: heat shock protein 15 [Porticoccaceae bacterium]|tara:strand:- start:181 stop:561 length:381 start_codon:yes stop_codon:yes gene_type:complete
MEKVRLDQWLWAARFYKTRSLSKTAINSGKVKVNGKSCKPSKEIVISDEVLIRAKHFQKTVIVSFLSNIRQNATLASKLYVETEESIDTRLREQALKKSSFDLSVNSVKPNKKQRRQLDSFLNSNF